MGRGSNLGSAALLALLLVGAAPSDPERAARIHREALVFDGHNDVGTWILDAGFDLGMDGADPRKRNAELYWVLPRRLFPLPPGNRLRTHTDLDRLERGGVDAQFFSVFAHPRFAGEPGGTRRRALEMLAALERQAERHPDRMGLARSSRELREVVATHRVAMLLGLEGGHAIENDLGALRDFYERGIRYMTLTWSNSNDWADSSSDTARHAGLSAFGREVVREMNRLGMIVDVSHAADDTFWDVIETTRAPLMASHSSARALVDVPRNMSDEMLRAVAENGGVVLVNFGGAFVDPRKANRPRLVWDVLTHLGPSPIPCERVLEHIDHIAQVAGTAHVGLGSDFDGTLFLPEGLRDVSGFPRITEGLLARGYSEEEIFGILGGNALRVLEAVETAAEGR